MSEFWFLREYDPSKKALLLDQIGSLILRTDDVGLALDAETAYRHIAVVTAHREAYFYTLGVCQPSLRLFKFLESTDLLLHFGDKNLRMDAAITAVEVGRSMLLFVADPPIELYNNMLRINPKDPDFEEQLADRIYDPIDHAQSDRWEIAETISWCARPPIGRRWPRQERTVDNF